MAKTQQTGVLATPASVPDVGGEHSTPNLRRFATLAIALTLLRATFKSYGLEQPAFFVARLVFGGFAVSYWLPFRFKETFFILPSLAGARALPGPVVAGLHVVTALTFIAIIRSSLDFLVFRQCQFKRDTHSVAQQRRIGIYWKGATGGQGGGVRFDKVLACLPVLLVTR